MANRYDDRDDRDRGREFGDYDRQEGYRGGRRGEDLRSGRNDRDFLERAGDEVRSWFGDDEAARRRDMDAPRYERERSGYGRNLSERGHQPGWRDRQDEEWRTRRFEEGPSRGHAAGLYTGSLDSRDFGMRESGRDRESRYFADREPWRTSGRGRDYGDDDRSWLGGGPNWGREFGWGRDRGSEEAGRYTGRGPRGYQRSDDRIREDVCDRLTMHGDVDASNVEVEVAGAEVTLRGTVDSRSARRLAEDIAESVHGVRHVHNEIRVGQAGDTAGTGGASGGLNAGAGGVAGAAMDPAKSRERVR
jgi:osmotically-inducible protein OsmY